MPALCHGPEVLGVLVVLCLKDCYGYELVQTISRSIDIAEGYFTTCIQESAEGPARKYYQISNKGWEYQKALLEEWTRFITGVNALIGKEALA